MHQLELLAAAGREHVAVAAGEQDRQAGVALPDGPDQFDAAGPGMTTSENTTWKRSASLASSASAASAFSASTVSKPSSWRALTAKPPTWGLSWTTSTQAPAPSAIACAVRCGLTFAGAATRGRYKVKTAPRPGSLCTVISPPDCWAKPITWDKPSPVPFPTPLVVKNGSKIWSS